MAREKMPKDVYSALRKYFAACPYGQSIGAEDHPPQSPSAGVYRLSDRSVTMRCSICGLLWTMTAHQMAKVARRQIEIYDTKSDESYDRFYKYEVRRLRGIIEWSERVDERRGRLTQ